MMWNLWTGGLDQGRRTDESDSTDYADGRRCSQASMIKFQCDGDL